MHVPLVLVQLHRTHERVRPSLPQASTPEGNLSAHKVTMHALKSSPGGDHNAAEDFDPLAVRTQEYRRAMPTRRRVSRVHLPPGVTVASDTIDRNNALDVSNGPGPSSMVSHGDNVGVSVHCITTMLVAEMEAAGRPLLGLSSVYDNLDTFMAKGTAALCPHDGRIGTA